MEEKECCCMERKKVRSEEGKKKLISRLNRIIGQMNGIKKMVEEDRYCDDILIQLSAVDKSIRSLASVILDEHLHTCVVEHIRQGDEQALDEIVELFRRFQ